MIRLILALDVKYDILEETSPVILWNYLESMYISKSLTNNLYSKKTLYQLIIEEDTDIRDKLNCFNKLITQLTSVGMKIDKKDKALLLLISLNNLTKAW